MSQGSSAPMARSFLAAPAVAGGIGLFLIAAAGCDRAVPTAEARASASGSSSVKPPPAGNDGLVRPAGVRPIEGGVDG
jgi:hypothetical protein